MGNKTIRVQTPDKKILVIKFGKPRTMNLGGKTVTVYDKEISRKVVKKSR